MPGAQRGRKPSYSRDDVALAYELRQEGCSWKLIGYGIGCGSDAIRKAVRSAMISGVQEGDRYDGKVSSRTKA